MSIKNTIYPIAILLFVGIIKSNKYRHRYGLGKKGFSLQKYYEYKKNNNVFLCVYDITDQKMLFTTKNASKNIEAASISKVCAAMAALDNNGGTFKNAADYISMSKLLIDSDNASWDRIQELAGGKQGVNEWSSENGYMFKPACVGTGNNQTNAIDMCHFWSDVFHGKYLGWEKIIELTAACATHDDRSLKYMPKNIKIGGKTGTFETANHDSCWLEYNGKLYSITILTLLGENADNIVATLFKGLFDEYIATNS